MVMRGGVPPEEEQLCTTNEYISSNVPKGTTPFGVETQKERAQSNRRKRAQLSSQKRSSLILGLTSSGFERRTSEDPISGARLSLFAAAILAPYHPSAVDAAR